MILVAKAKKYLTRRSGRSQMVVKNAAGALAIKAVSMIIDFIKVPIYLTFLDSSHYGVYITIASIVAWTHKFDFGLGSGLRYKLTQAISLGETERGKQLVSTAYISMSAIMLAVLILSIPIVLNLDWPGIINCNFIDSSELVLCVFLILSVFVVQFVLELISVVLQSDQRAAISTVFKPSANLLSLVTILLLIPHFHNSLVIACLALTIPIIVVLFTANVYLFYKRYKRLAPSFKDFRKDCIKDIYSLGLKYFASQLSTLIVFSTASFLLSHYVAPSEATVYNVAWTYYGVVVLFNAMVQQPLVSAVTDAYVKNDTVWVKNIFKKIRLYSAVLSFVELLMLIAAPFLFKLWLGDRLEIPFALSVAMTIYFIINVWVNPYSNFIGGVGKMNISVLLSAFKIVLFFPVAIAMVKLWGSVGLIITIIVVNTLPNLIIGVIQYNMIISNKAKGIWNK